MVVQLPESLINHFNKTHHAFDKLPIVAYNVNEGLETVGTIYYSGHGNSKMNFKFTTDTNGKLYNDMIFEVYCGDEIIVRHIFKFFNDILFEWSSTNYEGCVSYVNKYRFENGGFVLLHEDEYPEYLY